MNANLFNYKANVVRVLDGDTIEIDIDLGFSLTARQRVRLFGINAPEIHSSNQAEKDAGMKSVAFLRSLLPVGIVVDAKTVKDEDKFGRFLASILLPDGRDVATVMLSVGLVKPWDGTGKKPI